MTSSARSSQARANGGHRSEAVLNARLEARSRKAKKMADLLAESRTPEQMTDNLLYFRRFATTNGGLLAEQFRMAIWPVLAEHLPRAESLEQKQRPQGPLASDTGSQSSDSDFFESARSSFSSTASTNGDEEEEDDAKTDLGGSLASSAPTVAELQTHAEWNQVELDVNRTLARFPPNISETERLSLQSDLTPMIVELLYLNKSFRYYQGECFRPSSCSRT